MRNLFFKKIEIGKKMNRLFQDRNNKFLYYFSGHLKRLYPKFLLKLDLDKLQQSIKDFDEQSMYERLNYYHKVNAPFELDDSAHKLENISSKHGVYSLDLMEYTRFFPQEYKLSYLFGDITHVPSIPAVTKSRPVSDNDNSILMKFDKVRHFYMVKNDIKFKDKKNKLIWRGAVCQPHRISFMQSFFNKTDLIDAGDFNKGPNAVNKEWRVPFTSIKDQLEYKFILSIEGNDVATSTKWIMSSNSLLFMTKPKFETWLMEGRLIPNYHYVLVNDDYSNLEEKINYYIENTDEAEEIISNANHYMLQFKDLKSEDWLHLKILERYFRLSGQMT